MDFFTTYVSDKAIEYVNQVLKSGYLSEGEWVDRFEEALKEKFGFHHVCAVNSATSGLFLSLKLAGVKEGDEVILSSQTFVATGLSILYHNAKPIFVDIDKYTGCIDVYKIERHITSKTKAIMVVHWGGNIADLQEINRIADKYNIKVIEDASPALGGFYHEIPIGNYSDFTVFSFQAIKSLSTGDGGLITFRNPYHEVEAKKSRWFGIDKKHDRPDVYGERVYSLDNVGYKMHMNNISAAIGLGNLADWDRIYSRKMMMRDWYNSELENIPSLHITGRYLPYDSEHGNWLYTILVEDRDKFISKMQRNNIPVSVVHRGIHRHPIFKTSDYFLETQKYWDEHQISIPFHANLTDEDINLLLETIKSGW